MKQVIVWNNNQEMLSMRRTETDGNIAEFWLSIL